MRNVACEGYWPKASVWLQVTFVGILRELKFVKFSSYRVRYSTVADNQSRQNPI